MNVLWTLFLFVVVGCFAFTIGAASGRHIEDLACQHKIDAMSQAYGAYSGSNGF